MIFMKSEKNYEQTKNMSSRELIEYYDKKGKEATKCLGILVEEVADTALA